MNKTLLERFTSRKFLVAVGTAVMVAFEGTDLYDRAALVVVGVIYILAQGRIDKRQLELNAGPSTIVNAIMNDSGPASTGPSSPSNTGSQTGKPIY